MKVVQFAKALILTTVLGSSFLSADQVFLDDLIVDGSGCFGMDCVNGEDFGFSTIRLKENNLRIQFTDTSTSSSFPTDDWQITINDSANGGENYFSVDNVSQGKKLLKVHSDGAVSMGENLASTFLLSPSGDLAIHGTLSDSSDVNLKENITPVQNAKVLEKISKLPISTWNYKENAHKDRHIGAMAQDFYSAFEFGPDELHIAPKDAAFVAMVGVKELLTILEQRDAKIAKLEKKVAKLEELQLTLKNLEAMLGVLLTEGEKKTLASNK